MDFNPNYQDDWRACSDVLAAFFTNGITDPYCLEDSIVSDEMMAYARAQFEISDSKNNSDYFNGAENPKSMHFRESSRGRLQHPSSVAPWDEWTVELARFEVPRGAIGIVKGFEQYLAQNALGQLPGFVYTQTCRWGIPGPWLTGLANPIADQGLWSFQLWKLGQISPVWMNFLGPVNLPGLPYTDFPQEEELWFPAGSPASQNIHLVVPGGWILRLFFRSPAQAVRIEVAAKLKGFVQSAHSEETKKSIRSYW